MLAVPHDYLSRLHSDLLNIVLTKLPAKDVNTMAKVSRLFNRLANDVRFWESKLGELGLQVWDKKLGAKQEFKIYSRLEKTEFAFVNKLIGPIGPKQFLDIPEVCFIHTRKILSDWLKAAPTSPIVRGVKYETHLHKYINIMAFFIEDHSKRQKTIIMAREIPDMFTEGQKDYLQRLLLKKPCGSVQCDWKGSALEEGPPMILRREYDGRWEVKRKFYGTAVELTLPTSNKEEIRFFGPHASVFIYF